MIKQFFKDALLYGGTDLAFKLLSFLAFPLFTHYLSVEEYGVLGLAQTAATFLAIFFLGILNSLQRFYWEPDIAADKKSVFFSTLLYFLGAFTVAVVGTLWLVLGPLEDLFSYHLEANKNVVLLVLAGVIPSQLSLFCLLFLRVLLQSKKFAVLSFLQNALTLALNVTFVIWLQWGVAGFLVGTLLGQLISLSFGLLMVRQHIVWEFHVPYIRKVIAFGSPYILMSLGHWCFIGLDRWMLGELSGTREVGLYSIAFKMSTVISMVTGAFAQAWVPHVFKRHGTSSDAKEVVGRFNTLWFFILSWMAVNLFLFAPELIMMSTPESYWAAIPTTLLVCYAVFYMAVGQISALGITINGRLTDLAKGTWTAALFNFLLNRALIPTWGAAGAAAATAFCNFSLATYFHRRSQQVYYIAYSRYALVGVSGYLLLSLVLGIVLIPDSHVRITLLAMKSLYSILGLGLPFVIGIVSWEDVRGWVSLLRQGSIKTSQGSVPSTDQN